MDDWLNLPLNMKGVFFLQGFDSCEQFYKQASFSINA